mgnify:CR=1 FL=1
MNGIGILEENRRRRMKDYFADGVYYEKFLVEENFDWLKCRVEKKKLVGYGVLSPRDCQHQYEVLIEYSPYFYYRPDRVQILKPDIPYDPKIHMYPDKTLCVYYPKDIAPTRTLHLVDLLPWVAEWPVKYEFWKKYKVWLGEEVPH